MFLQVYGRLHHQLCASSRCFVSFATILCYLIIFFPNNMACNTCISLIRVKYHYCHLCWRYKETLCFRKKA